MCVFSQKQIPKKIIIKIKKKRLNNNFLVTSHTHTHSKENGESTKKNK